MVFKLISIILLVLANGFFVAVEFALVSVRRARIELLASSGRSGAKAVLRALDHIDALLSATQFGITLASLALGAVGESTIAHIVEPVLQDLMPVRMSELAAHTFSIAVALAVITYLHLVLGEYAPKALAIEKAEAIALAVARPMELFYKTFKPFIWLINRSGITLLKLFGFHFKPGHHPVYTEEEIRHLINQSHQSGHLELEEKTLIHNVFEFADLTAREIMIPRTEITAIEERASLEEVVRMFQTTGYSRLPVYHDNFDNITGILHNKDVMPYLLKPETFSLRTVMHQPLFIPDTAKLGDVLRQLQQMRVHLGVVVDEHGGVEGILTLEDILEEIVGEIQDEHDEALVDRTRERGNGIYSIEGGMSVREINRRFNLNLPESEDYTTIAGFMISQAGRLLVPNDSVQWNGTKFTVERVARRRITRVRMETVPEPSAVEAAH
ncbi:MAG TPA: hemolysin family protein [Blastocatellia bacterium]|nr:hemolysin family protein [Blastocatellia bacterium]